MSGQRAIAFTVIGTSKSLFDRLTPLFVDVLAVAGLGSVVLIFRALHR